MSHSFRTSNFTSKLNPETQIFESAIELLSLKPEESGSLRQLRQAVDFLSKESTARSRSSSRRLEEHSCQRFNSDSARSCMNLKRPKTFQIKRKPVTSFLEIEIEIPSQAEPLQIENRTRSWEEMESPVRKSKLPKILERKSAPSYYQEESQICTTPSSTSSFSSASSSSSSNSSCSAPSTPELTSTNLRSRSRSSNSSLEEDLKIPDYDLRDASESTFKPARPLRNKSRKPLQLSKRTSSLLIIEADHSDLLQVPISETNIDKKRQAILFYTQYTLHQNDSTSSFCSSYSEVDTEVFLDALSQL